MAKTGNYTSVIGTFTTIEFHVKNGVADRIYALELRNVTLYD